MWDLLPGLPGAGLAVLHPLGLSVGERGNCPLSRDLAVRRFAVFGRVGLVVTKQTTQVLAAHRPVGCFNQEARLCWLRFSSTVPTYYPFYFSDWRASKLRQLLFVSA